jgi:hypothetical protein
VTTVEERSARSHSAKHTLQIADESQTFAVLSTEYTVGDKKKWSRCIIIHPGTEANSSMGR